MGEGCLFFIQGGTFPEVAGTGLLGGAKPGGLFPIGWVVLAYLFFIQGGTFVAGCPTLVLVEGFVWGGLIKGGGLFCWGGCWDC